MTYQTAMENNQEDNNLENLEEDSNDSNKKRYRKDIEKTLAFFQKCFYLLFSVLLVIAIILIGMTYIKVITYLHTYLGSLRSSPGHGKGPSGLYMSIIFQFVFSILTSPRPGPSPSPSPSPNQIQRERGIWPLGCH